MIERYSRPEMANIWTEENKYRAWLEVEILADNRRKTNRMFKHKKKEE